MERNMSNDKLCTENEAISISGVSSRTLLRFSEAGYLTLHTAPDGSRRYERTQVEEIFGAASAGAPVSGAYESNSLGSVAQAAETFEVQDDSVLGEPPSQPTQQELATSHQIERPVPSTQSTDSDRSSAYRDSRDVEEIARLRNLLSLQERILDGKDDEIADLRNQRAWLRERIEKLEEKSDRDQILLLSETQTIRSLIAYQEARKSTFRQFLEWAGLYRTPANTALPSSGDYLSKPASSSSSSRTIEVPRAANSD